MCYFFAVSHNLQPPVMVIFNIVIYFIYERNTAIYIYWGSILNLPRDHLGEQKKGHRKKNSPDAFAISCSRFRRISERKIQESFHLVWSWKPSGKRFISKMEEKGTTACSGSNKGNYPAFRNIDTTSSTAVHFIIWPAQSFQLGVEMVFRWGVKMQPLSGSSKLFA